MKRLAVGAFVVDWVAKATNEYGNFGGATGIGLQEWQEWTHGGIHMKNWRLVAGVAYANYNGPNVECHIASDGSRRWLNREYLGVIFDYPFRQLKVDRITVCVGQGNTASRRFVQHLGFTEEAALAGAHPTGDLIIYRLRKPQCRWLTLRSDQNDEQLAA